MYIYIYIALCINDAEIFECTAKFNLNTALCFAIDNWKSKCRCFPQRPVLVFAVTVGPRPTRCHRPCLANAGRAEAAGEWQVPGIFFSIYPFTFSVRPRLDPSRRLLRDGIRDEHSPQLFPRSADYRKSMIFRKWQAKCVANVTT